MTPLQHGLTDRAARLHDDDGQAALVGLRGGSEADRTGTHDDEGAVGAGGEAHGGVLSG